MTRTLLFLTMLFFAFTARGESENESMFRALFNVWYRDNPPTSVLPTDAQQALLEAHRPVLYRAPRQTRFIDFYADYIANGTLEVGGEKFDEVDAVLLNQHRLDKTAQFNHKPAPPSAPAVVYARYDEDGFVSDGIEYTFEFLTYNLVFAHSGLPRGLPAWQRGLAALINGNTDWHQLDHYVAATVALYKGTPIAVTLQQHNYMTTFRIPQDITPDASGRLALDVAIGSNELYPHSEDRTRHPAVSFVTQDNIEFVMTGENRPMLGAYDVTHGTEVTEYSLTYLPHDDAFYGFRGKLGAKRKLPGRKGPPGADFNTLPGIKPKATAMAVSWRGATPTIARNKMAAVMDGWTVRPEGLQRVIDDFVHDANLTP